MTTQELNLLDDLAKLKIFSGWNSDTEMAKAIDLLFKQIQKRTKDEPISVTYAAISNQIRKYWKAQKGKYFGKQQAKDVEQFVTFFKQIVDDWYGGSLVKAYRNRFTIRDAYLWKLSIINNKKENSD